MDGQTPGYGGRLAAALPGGIDLGVLFGLALYSLLEFASTGSFGWQRSSYATAAETKAAVMLGIGAGLAAVGWYFLMPFGRLFSPRPLGWDAPEPEPSGALGLEGKEPSLRSFAFLLVGEIDTVVLGAFGVAVLMGVLLFPIGTYLPQAFPYVIPVGLLAFGAFLWSRIARLRRLCRIGTEVEAILLKVDTASDGEKTARYGYTFRGMPFMVSNSSWWLKALALRHGDHVIVLVDPRKPGDAVILGRFPTTAASTP